MKSFYDKFTLCHAPEGDGSSSGASGGAGANAGGTGEAGAAGQSSSASSAGGAGSGAAGDGGGSNAAAAAGSGNAGQAGPLLDQQGNFTKDWTKALGVSDDLAKFTSPKALAGSYSDLQKLIGLKGVIKPGPNATPQQIDAYHAALGRPEKPDGYGLTKPETIKIDGKDVPVPNEAWDAAALTKAQELFHRIGITKEQAAALAEFDIARGVNGQSKYAAAMEQVKSDAIAELAKEWGPADGAKFKQAVVVATEAALKAGMTPEEMAANPQLTNDPTWIRMMHRVGGMITEKSAAGLRDGGGAGANPSAQIAAIYADPQHPWHPANASKNPQAHREAVAQMKRLHELKAGG